MKILQLGTIPKEKGGFTETGGVATHVCQLTNNLASANHSVILFADNSFGRQPTAASDKKVVGFSVLGVLFGFLYSLTDIDDVSDIFSTYRSLGVFRVIQMTIYYFNLVWVYRRSDPDVVHAHHLEFRHYVATLVVDDETALVGTSHSIHSITHSEPEDSKKYRSIFHSSHTRCNHLVYVSEKSKNEIEGEFGTFSGHSQVIYNPVQMNTTEVIAENEINSGNSLLYVGEFSERKGVFRVIDAVSLVADEFTDLELILIGSDKIDEVKKYAEEAGVADVVSVLGRVDDINKWYNHADLFVVPTQSESFGLVFLEAMCYGTPVVGTTGVPEVIIPDKKVGYRVPPNDIESISVAVSNGLERNWNHNTISQHARSFGWEKQLPEYVAFYEEAIELCNNM